MGTTLPSLRLAAAAWLTAVVALAATGGTSTATSGGAPIDAGITEVGATAAVSPPPSVVAAEVGADLVQPGQLTICSSFPRVRFAEVDADGEPFGVDIDIGLEIAARLGLDAEVRDLPFDTLIDAVVGGGCDVSIAGQFITAGRLIAIDMIPYREGTPHVIVEAGDPLGIDELTDLCGRTLAVVSGTIHVEIVLGVGDYAGHGIDDGCRAAGHPTVDLREYPSQEQAEDALAQGDVDAYSGNDFVTVDRPLEFALSIALPPTRNGIGLRKGTPSLDGGIKGALRAMIADGTYVAILDRYDVSHAAISTPP
jgi:polar amino acid transport system substrate-binding protein